MTVDADEAIPTRWKHVTRTTHYHLWTTEKEDANYTVLRFGDKLLVVSHATGAPPGTNSSGYLVRMPGDVRTTFVEPAQSASKGNAVFLNLTLEQSLGWRWIIYAGGLLCCLLRALGFFNVTRSVRYRSDYSTHPALKSLAMHGDLELELSALDREAGSRGTSGIRLFSRWLIRSRLCSFDLLPLAGLVWGDVMIMERRGTFTRSRTYHIQLYDRNRRCSKIQLSTQEQAVALLQEIIARAPWMLAGNSEIRQAWRRNAQQIIEAVEERRKRYYASHASRGGAGGAPF